MRMTVITILLLATSTTAHAQYRCNVNGSVVFQEEPCVPQRKGPALEKMNAAELQAHFNKSKQVVEQQPPGYELYVPSDPGATFIVLEIIKIPPDDRLREITTKRIGRGGRINYSRRLYDCLYSQFKYLGSGESLSAMAASKPDAKLSSIMTGSIVDYVGREACK